MNILIISDKKRGHLNQSIAFSKLLNAKYDIREVEYKSKLFKLFSYIFDWLNVYTSFLYKNFFEVNKKYDLVVSAGSTTYYASKIASKKYGIKNIALMYPKGYKLNFYKIFAQSHDNFKIKNNITLLPVNFTYSEPINLIECKKCVALVIGGDNKVFKMDIKDIKKVVDFIFKNFKDYKKYVTTSPRTKKEIEEYIDSLDFDYKVIYSKNKINPIGDFLKCCEYIFVTIDSTSMISEAVSFGKSSVEVIPLKGKFSKYHKMVNNLEKEGFLHIFNGTIKKCNKKIDLKKYLKGIF